MKREEVKQQSVDNLITHFPLNGNLVESVSGIDMAVKYGLPTSEYKYRFVSDPTDSKKQCFARSATIGSRQNMQGTPPYFFMDYSANKLFVECESSYNTSSNYLFLTGHTVEFEWYPNTNNNKVYILESYDGLVGNNSQMYGTEIIRNGNKLYIKFTTGEYLFYTFTTGKWYKFVISYNDNGDGTYKPDIKLYEGGTLAADSSTMSSVPNIPYGNANKNNRRVLLLNSAWNYYISGANTTDYIRDFKIRKIQ